MKRRAKIASLLVNEARALRAFSPSEQVAALVQMALTEPDIAKALTVARFLNNPYVLRLFYNELVTVHYQELLQQGKLVSL